MEIIYLNATYNQTIKHQAIKCNTICGKLSLSPFNDTAITVF